MDLCSTPWLQLVNSMQLKHNLQRFVTNYHWMFQLLILFFIQNISGDIKEAAKIYKKEPLTSYQLRVNEEAARLAEDDASLLANRGELLEKARKSLVESGTYQFKKGRSRSKSVQSDSTNSIPSPSDKKKKSKLYN